jgi:hypothetical protein
MKGTATAGGRGGHLGATLPNPSAGAEVKEAPMALEAEFRYYKDHQDDLVAKHEGQFVVIKGDELLGVYPSYEEAYRETSKDHDLGTFLIQHVERGTAAYTQTFHSRVA